MTRDRIMKAIYFILRNYIHVIGPLLIAWQGRVTGWASGQQF